MQAIDNKFAYL